MIAEADNGIEANGALKHLLGVIDEHHGGCISAVAPAKGADTQRINELEVVPQISVIQIIMMIFRYTHTYIDD